MPPNNYCEIKTFASNSFYENITAYMRNATSTSTNYLYNCNKSPFLNLNDNLIKCSGIENFNGISIPIFIPRIPLNVRKSIGVYAQNNFCKEFTKDEFDEELICFSEDFIIKMLDVGDLIYDPCVKKYFVKNR